ncbi:cytochrome c biogenesis ATP-binding export protein CcmA [Hypericibacter terrae]|uniref:Cytochrome c biogenesis ATP-binding export protein CcmA n=1 Tax=Hypericibacter terrae TaxID=2602015 RepID=A0A5J6MSQ2_9PROT|nr:cytochrome c biogenesis ATP-binding export protein CcmA [Hypericibacter terrae]
MREPASPPRRSRVRLLSSTSSLTSPAEPTASALPIPALRVVDLACQRGDRLLFEDMGFMLMGGDLLLLTGPNGSGKSSLLRLLAGLNAPAAGSIFWQGRAIAEDAAAHRQRLRFLTHLDGVKPALTVLENLAFWAALMGGPTAAAQTALAAFDLERIADLPARFLSAGQRRRLALSRLVLKPAALWLLDEPSTSLDSEGSERLLAAIATHRAQGGLVILATHDRLALRPTQELRLANSGTLR